MRDLFPVTNDFRFPDSAFDNFFNGLFQPNPAMQIKLPKVDIEDSVNAYIITADFPGMVKEDINISYDNDVLTIAAQHNQEKEEKDEDKHYIRKERSSSTFSRQFIIRNIKKDQIEAAFTNGILKVNLPKLEAKVIEDSHRIDIK
jgi:HSP20 family protein